MHQLNPRIHHVWPSRLDADCMVFNVQPLKGFTGRKCTHTRARNYIYGIASQVCSCASEELYWGNSSNGADLCKPLKHVKISCSNWLHFVKYYSTIYHKLLNLWISDMAIRLNINNIELYSDIVWWWFPLICNMLVRQLFYLEGIRLNQILHTAGPGSRRLTLRSGGRITTGRMRPTSTGRWWPQTGRCALMSFLNERGGNERTDVNRRETTWHALKRISTRRLFGGTPHDKFTTQWPRL